MIYSLIAEIADIVIRLKNGRVEETCLNKSFISNNNSSEKQFLVKIKNKANKLNPEKHTNIENIQKEIIIMKVSRNQNLESKNYSFPEISAG